MLRSYEPSGDAVIEVIGVTKQFGQVTALHEINLTIRRGEFLSLLGPSGCGKSTLLRIIAGFETPTSGRVLLSGRDVTHDPPHLRPLNMVFQRYALFPHLTVADNVAFGLRLKRLPPDEIRKRVKEGLALVRLEGYEERMPQQLSGGQAQRVALARALVNQPEVLLLDEPLSALDRKIRQHMQEELKRIQAQVGTTFIYVTHDQEEAMAMSSRIALLRDGCIVQLADPMAMYRQPATAFAAGFVGDANILEGRVVGQGGRVAVEWQGHLVEGTAAGGVAAGGAGALVVRPEAIRICPAEPAAGRNVIPGTVVSSSFFGFYWLHEVQAAGRELMVKEFSTVPTAQPGMQVWLTVEADCAVVLPGGEQRRG